MQPHKRSLFDLFEGKKRYVVPLFQRQYVWNLEDQWQPLWEDIQRKFLEKLSGKEGPSHFLGAMVIDQKRFYGNEVPTHLIIDGQQRLTTFQIFLSAFRDVCAAQGHHAYAKECESHLLNTGLMAKPDEERYKIWPTNLDRKQFKDVIESTTREEVEKRHPLIRDKYARKPKPRPRMIECYLFFYDQISDLLTEEIQTTAPEEKVAELFAALRHSLQVVTIELDDNDDPQVIFESLNARGEPLLPSDLLRNYIFWRATQNNESQEELYNTYWLAFDDPFWRQVERQGRLLRPRADLFLQHYLTLKRREEIGMGHLFAEYKYWITATKPFGKVCDELSEMERHRGFFRRLIEPGEKTPLGHLARTLKILDTSTVYPLVLEILGRELPQDIADGIFTDLESYVVRRAICGLTTKNYNRLFLSILNKLTALPVTRESFRTVLLELQGETSVWPRDSAFKKAWLTQPAYDYLGSPRIQWILQQIEEGMRSKKSESIEIKSPLTIEHILPQEWLSNWLLPNGHKGITWFERFTLTSDPADVEASNLRDKVKHTFGNLTLVSQSLNATVSNGGFEAKKTELLSNSALELNRYFYTITDWNEEAIRTRGDRLFTFARDIWPHPVNEPIG